MFAFSPQEVSSCHLGFSKGVPCCHSDDLLRYFIERQCIRIKANGNEATTTERNQNHYQ
jgi:hypothetical protein